MIKITNLYKRFGEKRVLQGLDLFVPEKVTHAILGPSGVGKSVLLKHIVGLLEPDDGEIEVDGEKVDYHSSESLEEVRKKVAFLFQGAALFDSMTVGENVGFALREQLHLPVNKVKERVAECLRQVDLPGIEDKYPSELSGGMQKRVALARAVAPRPKVLLYDEPTTGLDPVTTTTINELIEKMRRQYDVTGIVITHDIQSARDTADKVSFFSEGQLVWTGRPFEMDSADDWRLRTFLMGQPADEAGRLTTMEKADLLD